MPWTALDFASTVGKWKTMKGDGEEAEVGGRNGRRKETRMTVEIAGLIACVMVVTYGLRSALSGLRGRPRGPFMG
jgi:hypothetical protein